MATPTTNGSREGQVPKAGPSPQVGSLHGNFRLLQNFSLEYAPTMSVQKWKSEKTGLTVVWADFDSPLLNAYMTVPTEAFDDSGWSHSLEHLCFLGSHDYPYKGILDTLANRSFASGTNAWTANDHTAYTLTTASSDGFLRMLPIYADHLFRPTLTQSGFVTEVYHINGKAQDAGVVFSEMQGRENTSGDLMQLRLQRSMYPEGNAYRSETGGLMEKLRVMTIDQIREQHSKYYSPHNVAIVLTGPLPVDDLLRTINNIDQTLIEAGKAPGPSGPPGWVRPFVETASAKVPVIDGTEAGDLPTLHPVDPPTDGVRDRLRRKNTIEFPEEDESTGEVCITWVGTELGQWLEDEAINVLETYLTDSAVSPIQKAFVEVGEPLCTDVYFAAEDKAGKGSLTAFFSSVPTAKLESLDVELVKLLEKVAADGIDMERMAMCIRRDRVKLLNQLETKPADSFADVLISDHLYGRVDGSELQVSMDDMKRYDELAKWTSQQWTDLIRKWYTTNPRLVVIGKPSKQLAKKIKKETKALEETRRKELGKEGLAAFEKKVEEARKENDRPIPEDIINGFRIPNENSIAWIQNGQQLIGRKPATGRQSEAAAKPPAAAADSELDVQLRNKLAEEDATGLAFPIQFTQVPSAFVSVSLVFPTTALPAHLRPLMHLYLSTFFSLPLQRADGTTVPFEAVVRGLDEDTLEYEGGMGVGGGFAENVCIDLKVEKAKYSKAIEWLRDLVWHSQFALDRLKVSAAKTTQSLPELKRDGRSISWSLSRSLSHDAEKSSNRATSILSLLDFMPKLNADLAANPDKVVEQLQQIRKTVFRPENMVVAVGGDVCGVDRPIGAWKDIVGAGGAGASSCSVRIPWSREVLTDLGQAPKQKGLICSLPTIESSYAVFTAKGISDFDHPDNAALVATIAMLNALESFLWRYIRGAGLAYGASIRSDVETSHVTFSLYRSPDSAKAYTEARRVIKALCEPDSAYSKDNNLVLDQSMLDSAKSLLHFSVAEGESTVGSSAAEVFVDEIMRGVGRGRGRRLLERLQHVTLADCQAVLQKYILPAFDPATSMCAIVSAPSRVEEIQKSLAQAGYEMERRDLDFGKDDEDGEASGSDSESGSESGSGSDSGSESESGGDSDTDMKV